MTKQNRIFAVSFVGLFLIGILLVGETDVCCGCVAKCPVQEDEKKVEGADEVDETERLKAEQKALADKYKLLEEKLFSLHEYEKDQNPLRSKLLERAFLQSQEKMTVLELKQAVQLLEKAKLKDAEKQQGEVLKQLNSLLELLQSEDRGKRVRDDIKRHQEYLKEVERLLRIQKGLRGQADGGVEARRLANSQGKAADRAEKLANEIQRNEGSGESAESGEPSESGRGAESGGGAQEGSQGKSGAEGAGKEGGEAEPKDPSNNQRDESANDSDQSGKPGESEPSQGGDPNQGDSNQGEGDPDGAADGKSGESKSGGGQSSGGQGGEGGSEGGQSGDSPSSNPVRKRIQAAEQRMRDAQQKLEKAKRENAIEDMVAAERELAQAKRELEEILRQLREEEVDRVLALLEGRFRQMLEKQVKIYESTRKLDRTAPNERGADFEIQAGKLSMQQTSLAKEAARALMILREDGSSVAFPVTVEEMQQDMGQVAARLGGAKVGKITIQIEEDIIDTLDYLIEALVKTQQDMERMKQQNSSQQAQGNPGDRPLVDQLAEIKMLRGLQERIFRRHRRYSRYLDDPEDEVGSTDDPDLTSALDRLAEKQVKLTNIARDIVNELNK